MNGHRVRIVLFVSLFFFLSQYFKSLKADYVLPYPSYMPGHKLYRISKIIDEMKKFWYWGSIASLKYHLGLADKYLVEAKTLFEYKQYLLATDALQRSTQQFDQIPALIKKARKERKDVPQLEEIVKQAGDQHIRILNDLINTVPSEFIWKPEKGKSAQLLLKKLLESAIKGREVEVK